MLQIKPTLAFFVSAAALSCVPAFAAASGAEVSESNLGNVMYVGDSITHGVNSASWRWAMHKILVDAGVSYDGIGYKTGNYSGGVAAGTVYGGGAFSNAHSSQASARAYEIAGRKSGGRFDNTNIQNWLGLSATTTAGATYTGATFDVDTFFLLIGTNDLLSDNTSDRATAIAGTLTDNLLGTDRVSGDMGTIVDAMYKSNSAASVTVLSLPCWTKHANNNGDDVHQAVAAYNENLKTWVSNYNTAHGTSVKYVDLNKGILDVASSNSFFGVSSMFNNPGTDGIHPNAQGDLLIAGNVAKALGYAGRSAGQKRMAAADFSTHVENFAGTLPSEISTTNTSVSADGKLDFSASGESTLVASWATDADLASGYTVDFGLVLGNGSVDGWDTATNLSVTIGDTEKYGVLNINEAYIQWGEKILYSQDMSQNADALRVAYVVGNAKEGLSAGYYVWLGDMLIGEALGASAGTENSGVKFSYAGSGTLLLDHFSMDGSGSYAPTTTGYVNADAAYIAKTIVVPKATPQGEITFPSTSEYTKTATGLAASGTYNARAAADTTSGSATSVVGVTISSGAAKIIYANSGNYTGDVYVTVEGGSASAWFGAHGGSGNLNGNVGLRITGESSGGSTVFGAVNAGTVSGNVYLDFSAGSAEFGSFTGTNAASVVGAYGTNITGTLHVQIGAGTFKNDILGGIHTGAKSIGKTEIFINGGKFNANVYGGGITGTIGNESSSNIAAASIMTADSSTTTSTPATSVVITSGTISGNVYGGGKGDTIKGDTQVVITSGVIQGNVYGGGASGTISGNTSVTIDGALASIAGTISGGGAGGTISGNAVVTLKNIETSDLASGFDKYAGTISGGTNVAGTRTLVLYGVKLTAFGATLSDFDTVSATNGTATALTSIGGASRVELAAGTSLSVNADADLSALSEIVLGKGSVLDLNLVGATTHSDSLVVVVDDSDFKLIAGTSTGSDNFDWIKFRKGGELFDATATIPDAQAGTVFLSISIPEPSAFGLIAGTLALALCAARRRRGEKSEASS